MLSSLQAILKSLTTIRTIRRDQSADYFIAVLQPLHEQLQDVHADYKRSFQACFTIVEETVSLADIRKKIVNQLKQDIALSEDVRSTLLDIVHNGAEFRTGPNFLYAIIQYLNLGAQTVDGQRNCNARRMDLMEQLTHIIDRASEWKDKKNAEPVARDAMRSWLEVALADLQHAKARADHLILIEKLKLKGIKTKNT